MKKIILCSLMVMMTAALFAAEAIQLPAPRLNETVTLKTALQNRRTVRQFSDRELPPQVLSNILWCAYGINRPDGRRTMPAALGKYAISIYILRKDGAFLHDVKNNTLTKVSDEDLRVHAEGRKTMGPAAGAVLLLAADKTCFDGGNYKVSEPALTSMVSIEAGAITQNIYLAAAAEGLNTCCCGSMNQDALTQGLALPRNLSLVVTFPIGFPPAE